MYIDHIYRPLRKLVTAPSVAPVTINEAKAHCRVDFSDDDALITNLIDAATSHFDLENGILGRALMSQTWDILYHEADNDTDRFYINIVPLISVTGIYYYDVDGVEQTVDANDYYVITDNTRSYIELKPTKSWATTDDRDYAWRIRVVAGYASQAACPDAIKQAILLLVGSWYENREVAGTLETFELPYSVQALIQPYILRGWK